MEELNEIIEEQKVKLSQLRTEQVGIRRNISETTTAIAQNTQEIEKNSEEVNGSNQNWTVLKGTLANLSSEVLSTLGRKLLEVGKNVISVGEQFTAGMSEVQAISGASAKDMERLEATAREYGATTKFTASESAQALKYMALAGWDTNESISALGGVLDLAAAGGMDLARASDIVTDYITAFGMSAQDSSEFVDTMAYAMAHSNTNVEQLGEAYKNCAATAASMGFSVQDVTAVLMTMANAGVKGGEAGTTLNTILTRLATDTKSCATELEQFGVKIYDDSGNLQSLSSILEGVSGAFSVLNQEQQANLSKMIAGTNQYSGFQTIMQGLSESAKETGSSFGDYARQLENVSRTSQDMAKTMNDNLSGDIKTMQSAFEELGLKIYEDAESPLRGLVQTITKYGVPALEGIIKSADKTAPIFVGAAGAIIGYKSALGMTSLVNAVIAGFKALKAAKVEDTAATAGATVAQEGLNAAMSANPIGVVVGALGLLIGTLGTFAAMNQNVAHSTDEANSSLDQLNQSIAEAEIQAAEKIENTESEIGTLNSLKSVYDDLRIKTNLTAEEKRQLEYVSKELADTLGLTIESLKNESGAYVDLTTNIDEYITKLRERIKFETNQDRYTAALKDYNQAVEAYKKASDEFESTKIKYSDIDFSEQLGKLSDEFKRCQISAGEYMDKEEELYESYKAANQATEQAEQNLTKANTALVFATDSVAAYEKALGSSKDEIEIWEYYWNQATDSTDKATEANNNAVSVIDVLSDSLGVVCGKFKNVSEVQKEATEKIGEYEEKIKGLRSEMNSLSSTYSQLANGQSLSYSNLLDLVDKYPEYTQKLLEAKGNIDLQKQAISELFEAKKAEYILSQQKSIDEIESSNKVAETELKNIQKRVEALQALGNALGINMPSVVYQFPFAKAIADLNKQIAEGNQSISEYQKKIKLISQINVNTFTSTESSSAKSSYSSGSSGGTTTKKTTKTNDKSVWTMNSQGVYAEGNTAVDAELNWLDRMVNLGKLNTRQQISQLEYWKKKTKMSADERYEIEKRLYDLKKELADQEQKQISERQKQAEERQKANIEKAEAAFEKLTNDRIAQENKKAEAAEASADRQIAAIDAVLKKHNEENEDKARQDELDKINAQLKYAQLDDISRKELLRKKQDLLNEQYEVNYQRNMENKKESIQQQLEAKQASIQKTIDSLQNNLDTFMLRAARIAGTQTAAQQVVNNNQKQNIQIVQNALNNDQVVNKLLKALYTG